jgi:hypothetical protein
VRLVKKDLWDFRKFVLFGFRELFPCYKVLPDFLVLNFCKTKI